MSLWLRTWRRYDQHQNGLIQDMETSQSKVIKEEKIFRVVFKRSSCLAGFRPGAPDFQALASAGSLGGTTAVSFISNIFSPDVPQGLDLTIH